MQLLQCLLHVPVKTFEEKSSLKSIFMQKLNSGCNWDFFFFGINSTSSTHDNMTSTNFYPFKVEKTPCFPSKIRIQKALKRTHKSRLLFKVFSLKPIEFFFGGGATSRCILQRARGRRERRERERGALISKVVAQQCSTVFGKRNVVTVTSTTKEKHYIK